MAHTATTPGLSAYIKAQMQVGQTVVVSKIWPETDLAVVNCVTAGGITIDGNTISFDPTVQNLVSSGGMTDYVSSNYCPLEKNMGTYTQYANMFVTGATANIVNSQGNTGWGDIPHTYDIVGEIAAPYKGDSIPNEVAVAGYVQQTASMTQLSSANSAYTTTVSNNITQAIYNADYAPKAWVLENFWQKGDTPSSSGGGGGGGDVPYADYTTAGKVRPIQGSGLLVAPGGALSLNIATSEYLGGVKIPDSAGFTLKADGTLSVSMSPVYANYTAANVGGATQGLGGVKVLNTIDTTAGYTNSAYVPNVAAVSAYGATVYNNAVQYAQNNFISNTTSAQYVDTINGTTAGGNYIPLGGVRIYSTGGIQVSSGVLSLKNASYVSTANGHYSSGVMVPPGGVYVWDQGGIHLSAGVISLEAQERNAYQWSVKERASGAATGSFTYNNQCIVDSVGHILWYRDGASSVFQSTGTVVDRWVRIQRLADCTASMGAGSAYYGTYELLSNGTVVGYVYGSKPQVYDPVYAGINTSNISGHILTENVTVTDGVPTGEVTFGRWSAAINSAPYTSTTVNMNSDSVLVAQTRLNGQFAAQVIQLHKGAVVSGMSTVSGYKGPFRVYPSSGTISSTWVGVDGGYVKWLDGNVWVNGDRWTSGTGAASSRWILSSSLNNISKAALYLVGSSGAVVRNDSTTIISDSAYSATVSLGTGGTLKVSCVREGAYTSTYDTWKNTASNSTFYVPKFTLAVGTPVYSTLTHMSSGVSAVGSVTAYSGSIVVNGATYTKTEVTQDTMGWYSSGAVVYTSNAWPISGAYLAYLQQTLFEFTNSCPALPPAGAFYTMLAENRGGVIEQQQFGTIWHEHWGDDYKGQFAISRVYNSGSQSASAAYIPEFGKYPYKYMIGNGGRIYGGVDFRHGRIWASPIVDGGIILSPVDIQYPVWSSGTSKRSDGLYFPYGTTGEVWFNVWSGVWPASAGGSGGQTTTDTWWTVVHSQCLEGYVPNCYSVQLGWVTANGSPQQEHKGAISIRGRWA